MKITNLTPGVRGINTVTGPVLVDPKGTIEAKVYEREKQHIEATQWFEIDGDYEPNPGQSSASQVTVNGGDGKDGVYIPAAEFNSMRSAFEDQATVITKLRTENEDLKKQIADRDADLVKLRAGAASQTGSQDGTFAVKEKSPGWFVIVKGDEEVTKSLRKDDVAEFPTMNAGDQAAFVELNKPA